MQEPWAISLDIEGFSKYYEDGEAGKTFAILGLGELMGVIHRIGERCFPGTLEKNFSERLFAHQYGDGFLVCADYPEQDGSRALAIAVAIMRHMMMRGYATKAAISTGSLSDIKGCYPKPMRDSKDDRIDLGQGIMTVMSVMGTALTKAHKLATRHHGAVLIVDNQMALPHGSLDLADSSLGSRCVDWIGIDVPLASELAGKARLMTGGVQELCEKFETYCVSQPRPPIEWIEATVAVSHSLYERRLAT